MSSTVLSLSSPSTKDRPRKEGIAFCPSFHQIVSTERQLCFFLRFFEVFARETGRLVDSDTAHRNTANIRKKRKRGQKEEKTDFLTSSALSASSTASITKRFGEKLSSGLNFEEAKASSRRTARASFLLFFVSANSFGTVHHTQVIQ